MTDLTSAIPPPPPDRPAGPPPWSPIAVIALVFSLLGCGGIPALLGLILGIVGIVHTRGGRRRGLGLAVAAIPISCLTGGFSLLMAWGIYTARTVNQFSQTLKQAVAQVGDDPQAAVQALRKIGTPAFNRTVSDEALLAWLRGVRKQHGTLTGYHGLQMRPDRKAQPPRLRADLKAKFVNGPASVRLSLRMKGLHVLLDDVAVDGVSVRSEGGSPAEKPSGSSP